VNPSALLGLSGTPVPSVTPSPGAAGANLGITSTALKLVNDFRQANGRGPLTANAAISAASTTYAETMARANTFSHTGPDGSTAERRLAAAGYRGRFRGEAIAAGQTSAEAVVTSWINSPSHRAILLDPTAVEVGIGYTPASGGSYGTYWVLNTGSP
jgi:uncharacterized protein YkwD